MSNKIVLAAAIIAIITDSFTKINPHYATGDLSSLYFSAIVNLIFITNHL